MHRLLSCLPQFLQTPARGPGKHSRIRHLLEFQYMPPQMVACQKLLPLRVGNLLTFFPHNVRQSAADSPDMDTL
jgi:hypothetical protein